MIKVERESKRIALGILAHVDAGKTTLSEGLLYSAGEIRKLGRVDTRDAFLDINEIERKRGITIFSKQAIIGLGDTVITLLDTPGLEDFSAETERTLSVLDYAVLVINGTDGIQSHTKTLWKLLEKHRIPRFVFINKTDLAGVDKTKVIKELISEFGDGFVDFTEDEESICESLALCDEVLMERVLAGTLSEKTVAELVAKRRIFPCFSGSALKMQGVDFFLKAFDRLTLSPETTDSFGAKVFKIGQDDKGNRLTYMKITGGSLKVRSTVRTGDDSEEKVNEIRIYSGEKYQTTDEAFSGCVCAVTGLKQTTAGQGLGTEENDLPLTAEPVFTYRVILPADVNPSVALEKFRELEQEETQLKVTWNSALKEIQLRIMGEIQLEILKQLMKSRFDMDVSFEEGNILYKETIENVVEGVGHFEPLRHYAEVHLVLSPLPRGSGVQLDMDCPESVLDKNWQRLVMGHLSEKQHIGTLTGSPITDIKITLKSGAAHLKHTEGGDFRQATYRAVRQGLMQAKSLLLEPYFDFVIEVPAENVGKVMTDLNLMGAEFTVNPDGETTKINGKAPAAEIRSYQRQITAFTRGAGRISCQFGGYGPCRNADEVIASVGYSPENDVENTADSVFCSHGAGFLVKWNQVPEYMHLESVLKPEKATEKTKTVRQEVSFADDEELMQIFERTYGKIKTKLPGRAMHTPKEHQPDRKPGRSTKKYDKSYLLIDGYNMIFAWDSLKKIATDSLESARQALIDRLSVYNVFKDEEIILVFDAYKVKGNLGEVERENGISVVYTKESQTADAYIEKTAKELTENYHVTVATSDALEQLIIFGSGALRMPAKHLEEELINVENNVRQMVKDNNLKPENSALLKSLEEKLEKLIIFDVEE